VNTFRKNRFLLAALALLLVVLLGGAVQALEFVSGRQVTIGIAAVIFAVGAFSFVWHFYEEIKSSREKPSRP